MVNIFSKTFRLLDFNYRIININNLFLNWEYFDDIFKLTRPKLLDSLNSKVSNLLNKVETPTNILYTKKVILSKLDQESDNKINIKKRISTSSLKSLQLNNKNNNYSLSKNIFFLHPISLKILSMRMNIPEAEIISYLFLHKSISVTSNDILDFSIVSHIIKQYSFQLLRLDIEDFISDKKIQSNINFFYQILRPPIITLLGHVDHGKTTLLDSILKSNFAQNEYGGITQSIVGYEMEWYFEAKIYKLIFLDTPGHESFNKIRLRGAQVTDIVLLLIAADDGLKPQTIESINYIKKMELSFIIVITKIDKAVDNINKIKKDLLHYDMLTQKSGCKTIIIGVSALTGQNIKLLLSKICMFSEIENLVADSNKLATGIILEAYLDKKQGPIASLIIRNGLIKLGDYICTSDALGKIKSITSLSNKRISSAGPSSMIKILGFDVIPSVGLLFQVLENKKDIKNYYLKYFHKKKDKIFLQSLSTRISFNIDSRIKTIKLILKTDRQGSLEAIINLLLNIPQSKVQLNLIYANIGDLTNSDIELAHITNSIILGFHLKNSCSINNLIKQYSIKFKNLNIIYDVFDYVNKIMLHLIEPESYKVFIGHALVKTVFHVQKKCIAGCLVDQGKLTKMCFIQVYRKDILVYKGILKSLKQMRSDVNEILAINECGLMSDYDEWQEFDTINAYDLFFQKKIL
uniref:Translation initiation factor IF-2, chloroplastic n=1 Tax=Harveyella mirabilis TaxID=282355 RepID=A0A3S8UW15_9FLOR|nr:translation initiation factor 2 [Harveyella mirabilis]